MRAARMLAGAVVLALALTGVTAMALTPGVPEERGDRGDLLVELAAAEERWVAAPDLETATDYATRLLEAGRFEEARGVIAPLLSDPACPIGTIHVAARLEYYLGGYDEAAALFARVVEADPANLRAAMGLVMCHYQTNDFEGAAALPEGLLGQTPLAHMDVMRAMRGSEPYDASWLDGRTAELPFLDTDPLPVVEVEIDGRRINAIIDTGADMFILDTEIADSLGMEPVATMTAMFAGGKTGELGFGVAHSLTLGGVELHNVPVSMLPTRPLSLTGRPIGGIIGTAVLRQFLSTMDYPGERLVLRERSAAALEDLRTGAGGRIVEDVPFYLSSTHFLLAHGSLNGHGDLLFHVDSGLAGTPAFAAPEETMTYLGIPLPEVEVREDVIGGGGGGFAVGEFDIEELGLGSLVARDLVGSFGGQPPGSYWRSGFIIDGLISHNFLRDYAWTLDFDNMRMLFSQ